MNAIVILLVAIAVLVVGYLTYGKWLAKQWGVDPSKETPAHSMHDGVDYEPAKAPVLMGHHFSSIAGAGPINGPIQASVFGWVPVLLWILVGGIFFGAVHDFGALFASIRNKGNSIGEVISETLGLKMKRLFIVFSYLTLILVVAAFASIVAGTFASGTGEAANVANERTAMISILFILIAIVFGFLVYRKNAPVAVASIIGVLVIIGIVALGYNWHPFALSNTAWMWICGLYILIAAIAPVWILLQPRDYLSSFLLYFMMVISIVGIIGGSGGALPDFPAFTSFKTNVGYLFPALFITIACGAISGFHSLVGSGTSSKQLDKESDARPIGYGAMLIECLLAVISMTAAGYVFKDYTQSIADGKAMTPTAVFAGGISKMLANIFGSGVEGIAYSLLILTVSVFCLTSLDTATRLARYMFQEFWTKPGEKAEDITGIRKILINKYVATVITVLLGIGLGLAGYAKVWGLFGAANQLLAALALLGVATWLGKIGRNNKMFFIPMAFMSIVTIVSLILTIINEFKAVGAGAEGALWNGVRGVIAILLVVLAVILVISGVKYLFGKKEAKA
ncbi:MAG: carbon starvation protein A [Lachnospiraceae bacterium]|jgi:carbon starvation protein|nr:carbon starvation protein A [Lachnospiraceae bacterium]